MKKGIYRRLALTGIRKNKQLYFPYLLSGTVMVMVFYILAFLAASDMVHNLRGGEAMTTLLILGEALIGVFSIPFLFYTSSALMRKRKKEFGLYNILGMNKGNILASLIWETLITYGIVMFTGICFGILFSKIGELGLVNIMEEEIGYRIYIEWKAVLTALVLYGGIYIFIFLNIALQIRQNNPIELLHSEAAGERPPKSRRVLAGAGLMLIIGAYAWALRLENPRDAMVRLMMIAGVVVVGTYLLFIAGSVFLCGWLKKRKRYYYKTAHFVTVSSLSYRMKRNGASLASICILATVILVALVGTAGFYTGVDDIIGRHYPYDLGAVIEMDISEQEEISRTYKTELEAALKDTNAAVSKTIALYEVGLDAPIENGVLDLSVDIYKNAPEEGNAAEWNRYLENYICVRVISLEDYNQLCHTSEELGESEVFLAGGKRSAEAKSIRNWDGSEYTVKKTVKQMPALSVFELYGSYSDMMMDYMVLVVPDMNRFWDSFDAAAWSTKNQVLCFWEYGVRLAEERERQLVIGDACEERIRELAEEENATGYTWYTKAEKWAKMKSLAGGVLFLALVISTVFVFAATLIMYYKQISEGYEDQRQFSVMRKIGMTTREIRRSINSQMLTVFGLPLLMAGVHLTFALPGIYQVLKAAVLDNRPLLIRTAAVSFLLFAIAYALVYLITTRTYFKIVNRK